MSSDPTAQPVAVVSDGESVNLDVLRSIAVLLVVVSHVQAVWDYLEGHNYHVGSLGLLGVITFFVHTCLVLMMSLERQTRRLGPSRRATVFFIRRAFRIYPLSIVVVVITHWFASSFGHAEPTPRLTLSNLLLIQNLLNEGSIPDPLWSLPFEVQMYLVLPILYSLLEARHKRSTLWLLALWGAAVALIFGLALVGANYHLIKYIPCFLPGVLAYAQRGAKRWLPAWLLFAFLALLTVALPLVVARGARENIVAWPICLALGLLIPRCREIQSRALAAAGKLIAKYSYGIYLVHVPAIALASRHLSDANPVLRWGVCILGALATILVAYHGIEDPGIRVGNRIATWWRAKQAFKRPRRV